MRLLLDRGHAHRGVAVSCRRSDRNRGAQPDDGPCARCWAPTSSPPTRS